VRAIYEANGPLTDAEFARQVFGDGLFTAAAQTLAEFVTKAGEPARVYHFAYVADHYKGKMVGVSHGGEIAYVFGLRGLGFIGKFASNKDRNVVAQTQAYWTNFAKTGDPNGPGLPAWPAFSPTSRETLVIDDTTKAVADFRKGQVGVMTARWGMRVGMTAP
jgi:para-nitrobenzyl esterase